MNTLVLHVLIGNNEGMQPFVLNGRSNKEPFITMMILDRQYRSSPKKTREEFCKWM